MSFKPEVKLHPNETEWYSNDTRFATREEAEQSARDLMSRWPLAIARRASESPDPVNYKLVNGTYYDARASDDVIKALERARQGGVRVRLFLGDAKTGKAWAEENDVIGRIGRSTGCVRVPLLIHSKRSMGGPEILSHCIVAVITTSGRVLYRHPSFHQGQWCVKGTEVFHNGEIYGLTKSPEAARRLCDFMSGARFSK